jgi:hypothetical protein
MKSAFAGFKRSLFYTLIRVYEGEGDFGYWSLTGTVAILHLNSIESVPKMILYYSVCLHICLTYFNRLILGAL